METKVPLHSFLYQLYGRGFHLTKIKKDLLDSVFGGIMKENTPYDEIIKCHPFNSKLEASIGQQICDRLNEHLKDPQLHLHLPILDRRLTLTQQLLTPNTLMDLKPFALLIGCSKS